MFSEIEQRFLRQEFATVNLAKMVDLRELGCPDRIVNRILENRAARLRAKGITMPAPDPELSARIEAAKLW